jgi:hypothetical protein
MKRSTSVNPVVDGAYVARRRCWKPETEAMAGAEPTIASVLILDREMRARLCPHLPSPPDASPTVSTPRRLRTLVRHLPAPSDGKDDLRGFLPSRASSSADRRPNSSAIGRRSHAQCMSEVVATYGEEELWYGLDDKSRCRDARWPHWRPRKV